MKEISSCDGICSKPKLYHIFEPFHMALFSLRNLDHMTNPNFTTSSICSKPKLYHIFESLFFLFSLRILITCQTQILLHFQFARNPNYTTFSNHYDLTCPRLIFGVKKKNSDSKMWYNLGFEQIEDVVKFEFGTWSGFGE